MKPGFLKASWFRIFGIGTVLFFGAGQALKITNDPGFITTTLLLGSFVVPSALVAYFYVQEQVVDRTIHNQMPLTLLLSCFLVGGVVGVIVAGVLEYETLRSLSVTSLVGVGFIEEAAKLIFPVYLFMRAKYRSGADGLLFGVASGMGFAALETMGYGLVSLMNTQGNVGALEQVLLVRGFLSPVGHAAWTGLVCGVLWVNRERTGHSFTLIVPCVFVLAVALHALWDIGGSSQNTLIGISAYVVIGTVSLFLLIRQLRRVRHAQVTNIEPMPAST